MGLWLEYQWYEYQGKNDLRSLLEVKNTLEMMLDWKCQA